MRQYHSVSMIALSNPITAKILHRTMEIGMDSRVEAGSVGIQVYNAMVSLYYDIGIYVPV